MPTLAPWKRRQDPVFRILANIAAAGEELVHSHKLQDFWRAFIECREREIPTVDALNEA